MALVLDGDNGIVGVLATNTDGDVIFDTDTLFVDAVENKVGIGTTSPSASLHISKSDDARLVLTDTGDSCTFMVRSDGVNTSIGTNTAHPVRFMTNNAEAMRIDSSGNVGIGTDDPGCALDITRTSGWAEMHLDGAAGGDLILKDDGVNYGEIYAGSGHGMVLKSYASQHMSFLTNADATAKMTIQSGGNVGIGTDSPSYKLDVASTIQIRAGESLRLQNVAGSSAATIQCAGAGTNSDLGFSTAGAERMRITSTGVLQGTSDAEIATSPIRTHSNTISTSTTIDANDNAVASGPLAIADGVTLTINGNMTVV